MLDEEKDHDHEGGPGRQFEVVENDLAGRRADALISRKTTGRPATAAPTSDVSTQSGQLVRSYAAARPIEAATA